MDHQHTLQLDASLPLYKCSGCKEIGYGLSYTCENSNCDYTLHKECGEPVKHAVHPFFKNCTFELREEGSGFYDACGKDLLGFFYCSRTGDALHPCCLNLEKNISDIMTLSHQVPSDCVICKQRHVERNNFEGWSYVANSDGKTCFHVSCFKALIIHDKLKRLNNRSKGRVRTFLKFTGKLALNMLVDIATGDISNSITTIYEAFASLSE